jgi:hypothetical protein
MDELKMVISERETVPVRSWRVRARTGSPVDVVALELSTGESSILKLDRAEGSLLLRACHPAMRWRVLAWEPHWSASVRVELRPAGDNRVGARVIDRGGELTVIYRVPLVVALAMARHGGLPVGLHRSLIGRSLEADDDPTDAAEVEGFRAFLATEVSQPFTDRRQIQMSMES